MDKKVGRNDPCPCGSGKKYKQCCWVKDQQKRAKFSARKLSPSKGLVGDIFSNVSTTMQSLQSRVKKIDKPLEQKKDE